MADLKSRIDQLVGSLSAAGCPGKHGPTPVAVPRPNPRVREFTPVLRAGDPGFAEVIARLVALPLDRYTREGAPLEIRVPWHAETLWLVPTDRDAATLGRGSVGRGRAWTATELIALMALPDRTPDIVQGRGRSMGISSRCGGDDGHERRAGVQTGLAG